MQQACTNRKNAAVIFLCAARRCENLVKTGPRASFVTRLTWFAQWCCNAPKVRGTAKNVTGSPHIEYLADGRPSERRRVVQFWCKKITIKPWSIRRRLTWGMADQGFSCGSSRQGSCPGLYWCVAWINVSCRRAWRITAGGSVKPAAFAGMLPSCRLARRLFGPPLS